VCRCRARFCFVCAVELADSDHYRHFVGPGLAGPFGKTCKGPKDSTARQGQGNAKEAALAKLGEGLANFAAR